MNRKKLKDAIQSRVATFGGWTSIGHPQLTELIVRSGVDFVGIDLEHSTISQEQAQRIIAACHAHGTSCIPRVAGHNSESIRRLLDSGADGMLVPTVETPQQVEKLVEWVKYPPVGRRGYGVASAQGYGHDFEAYTKTWNETSVLLIQIESIAAVENIDGLLQFDDVDGVMIGPYDLSGSLGVPGQIDSELVQSASQRVAESCKRHHKACGTHIVDPSNESIQSALDSGYTFMALASDVFILQKWGQETKRILSQFR